MPEFIAIRPPELSAADIDAWRAMQRAQPHLANPFLSPDFTLAMGEVSDRVRVLIVRDEAGIAGFLPYEHGSGGVGSAVGAWVSLSQGVIHRPGADFEADELARLGVRLSGGAATVVRPLHQAKP
jgi:CelD/BcsL family acetyltransferase involved in cellulose biosynthesis